MVKKDYKKLKKAFADDSEMLRQLEHEELVDANKELINKVGDLSEGLKKKLESELLLEFDREELKGYTPQKGLDYFTDEDVAQFKEEVRPKKGIDYFDGKSGDPGKDADEIKIIKSVIKQLPSLENIAAAVKIPQIKPIDTADIIKKVLKAIPSPYIPTVEDIVSEIKKNKLLELKDIKGARLDRINMNDQRWHGGGLSNITGYITAGTNITITGSGTSTDPYSIASTASTGDMTKAVYDPANISEQLVGLTAAQALSNKNFTSGTNTFPTFNQNTTGSAAKWTTARNLAGNSVDGSANVAFANKFIVQGTADSGLSAAQFLGALGTGIVKNTTTTGVLSIAVNTDLPVGDATHSGAVPTPPNNTTTFLRGDMTFAALPASGTVTSVASADGSITVTNPTTTVDLAVVKAPILSTARTIGGVSFNGSTNITVASATGGFTVSGGDLAIGANNLTITGSIGATGARATKVWTAALESTAMPTVGGTPILSSLTAPLFTTVDIGNADTTIARVSAGVISVEGVTIVDVSSAQALTNKDLSGAGNTFPTFNQNTTGSAAKWTTARNLAGNSVDGSTNVAFANKFIVQGTADAGLSAAQFLGALGTGIVKNTTTTGVLSIAVAGDFPTLNQSTTGGAATLTTARTLWGQSFDGSGNVTGSLTAVGNITGGASSMTITPGTGNSRTLTLQATNSSGTALDVVSINDTTTKSLTTFAQILTPTSSVAVEAGYSSIVSSMYTLGSGVTLTLGAGAYFMIL